MLLFMFKNKCSLNEYSYLVITKLLQLTETYRLFNTSLTSSEKDMEAGRGSAKKDDFNMVVWKISEKFSFVKSNNLEVKLEFPFKVSLQIYRVMILTKLYTSR